MQEVGLFPGPEDGRGPDMADGLRRGEEGTVQLADQLFTRIRDDVKYGTQ